MRAHQKFIESDGLLVIESENSRETGEKTLTDYDNLFFNPESASARPQILLSTRDKLTDGTYEHELTHFFDWYKTKKELIRKGYSADEAHEAIAKYEKEGPLHSARFVQWTEDRATRYTGGAAYPQIEAIRRLSLDSHFVKSVSRVKGRSKLRLATLDYVKEGIRKYLDANLRKPSQSIGKLVIQDLRNRDLTAPSKGTVEYAEAYTAMNFSAYFNENLATYSNASKSKTLFGLSLGRLGKKEQDALDKLVQGEEVQRHIEIHMRSELQRALIEFKKDLRAAGVERSLIERLLKTARETTQFPSKH